MTLLCFSGDRLITRDGLTIPDGLRQGDGVFETIRTYNGRPFRLDAHVARMVAGALALDLGIEEGAAKEAISKVVEANRAPGRELVIRPIICATGEGVELIVLADELKPYAERIYSEGAKAIVSEHRRLAASRPESWSRPVKWLSNGANAHSLRVARAGGCDEALLTDQEGRYVEGSRSNLFVVARGVILAPGPESGALDGVTRGAVLEIARGTGLAVEERPVEPGEVERAPEAFLTSSLLGVAPLVEVNGRRVGLGRPGTLTKRMRDGFAGLVQKECAGQ